MTLYSCLFVEDDLETAESFCKILLQTGVFQQPYICSSIHEALWVYRSEKIDVFFIDLDTLSGAGLEILKLLPKDPPVIAVSSRPEFAIECYELGIIDYIKKPYTSSRVLLSIGRLLNLLQAKPQSYPNPSYIEPVSKPDQTIYIKIGKRITRLQPGDIIMVQAYGIYCKIYSQQGVSVINRQISVMESELATTSLIRVHKSYIINPHYLTRIESRSLWLTDKKIPIGITYRSRVNKLLVSLGIREAISASMPDLESTNGVLNEKSHYQA
jgi:DNA-binding LytR/AlgR family response regulator